ncbi:hypothetical protein OZN62_02830 [Aurantiacibacter sp. MUD11]|uniref:hypothetical protein n=1 Tax=Aurantiacibacter sp. MUD11 TaxID=3003265 RepID=UPI0022AA6679|nr:hypothetical protein [Aurantiacibacter sp. MUD11]WAT18533.1 hypothetical protein OZN62_02830 [Aurantiacibacter sp. MUD11]
MLATPAIAQEEEPRTTYSVTMLKLTPGSENRWTEIRSEYVDPAREAAGLSPATVHWVMMNEDYDLIIITEMPRGMSTFDTHANAEREAFWEAMSEIVGGQEALDALGEEWDTLVESSTTVYTHTHP